MVRNYLGLALVHAFELRRVTLRRMILAAGGGGGGSLSSAADHDSEQQLWGQEQQTMLLWIDALWSCFLEVGQRKRVLLMFLFALA